MGGAPADGSTGLVNPLDLLGAKLLAEAIESVEIVDAQGNRLGFFARRFLDHEVSIAAGRAASGDAGRSTGEVLERLQAPGNR